MSLNLFVQKLIGYISTHDKDVNKHSKLYSASNIKISTFKDSPF